MTFALAITAAVVVVGFIAWVDPISRQLAKRGWMERDRVRGRTARSIELRRYGRRS